VRSAVAVRVQGPGYGVEGGGGWFGIAPWGGRFLAWPIELGGLSPG
jgi:hypothetical protein